MSGYALWTDLAIWVLVLGAPAVFAWFLKDALRLLRGLGREESPPRREESRPRREESAAPE